MIKGMSNIEYGERLKLLPLPTLSYGRAEEKWLRYGNITMYIITRLLHQPSSEQGLEGKCIRSSASFLGAQSCSFYYLATVAWNNLPASVVESDTINTFKNRLDNHWEDHPLRYNFLATTPNACREWPECWDWTTGRVTCPITSISKYKWRNLCRRISQKARR